MEATTFVSFGGEFGVFFLFIPEAGPWPEVRMCFGPHRRLWSDVGSRGLSTGRRFWGAPGEPSWGSAGPVG